jgi:transcriptional regulator with PAS, ATPase and Fis domain
LDARFTFENIKGESAELKRCIELAKIASGADSRVLITGETGTGKELFAHAIHNASERRNGPFVAINCAAIPKDLVESEIMGYVKGAYTGARQRGQVGKFELANGGTVFLDEIQQMPLDVQTKFLRVLQDGRITRLGDTKSIKVDVRVISSSNEDLYGKSITQEFRNDLYYRLSVVEINIPPLRDRTDDIIQIAKNILANFSGKLGKVSLELSSAAISCLKSYDWPGNIRELENFLEMAALVCKGGVILPRDLNDRIHATQKSGNSRSPLVSAEVHQASPKPSRPLTNSSDHEHSNASVAVGNTMREAEISLLREAMKKLEGNIAEVSRTLGISRSTIYRRMKEHGINKTVSIE